MRRGVLWLCLVLLAACGGASTNQNLSDGATRRWSEVVRTPQRVTLPEGRVLAVDEAGVVTFDGVATWRLELDGRLVGLDDEPVATLLRDGQISHRQTLSSWRLAGDHLIADGASIASFDGDTLVLALLEDTARVPVLGTTPQSRATLLYLLAMDRLERSRAGILAIVAQRDPAHRDGVFYRVPIDGAPSRGGTSALVTIVAFEDFQCPFCARAEDTLSRALAEYRGDLRVVYRHQPLPFHPHAMAAAEASMEAFAQQGPQGFWAMHALLYENTQALERPNLERFAAQLGLDVPRFVRALDDHTHRARIEEDMELGRALGATGTPTFFINGVELVGAQPYEEFHRLIERERDRAAELLRRGVAPEAIYDLVTRDGLTRAAAGAHAAAPAPQRPQLDPHAIYAVPVTSQPTLGDADALVTVVVFSDFECPFCARVEPTLAQLRAQYGNDLRIVWRNNPLPFHAHARLAAEAAMEVFAQTGDRGFWAFHALLFENQRSLERADLERLAATIRGVRMPRLRAALDRHTHAATIDADIALTRQLGATGTPAFFINGRNLRGAQPIDSFRTVIDEALVRARALVASGTPRARVYEQTIAGGATAPVMLPPPDLAPPPADTQALPTTPPDVAAPPPNAIRSASGLASRVLTPGRGTRRPGPTDRVTIHYSGWTTDGRRFDSSVERGEPATFPVNGVIAGFAEGLQLMVEGESRRLWIPESLAYQGRPNAPQGMLVFDIDLIRIEP